MLIPSFLYGQHRQVKAACKRKVTQLKRGAAWADLAGEDIDSLQVPGLLVLDGPIPAGGSREHFYLYILARVIFDAVNERLPGDFYLTAFEPAAATRWGFLAMLGQWGDPFLIPPGHEQRLLHHALHWWPELDAEGPRYCNSLGVGTGLWPLFTNIKYCLARQGLPEDLLREPLPEGGLAELVAQTRAGLPPTRAEMH